MMLDIAASIIQDRYMTRKLAFLLLLVAFFYAGMFLDPVMFYIGDLRTSLLGQ